MADSFFVNEITPITESGTFDYPLDKALLPGGDQALLYDNGAGGVVVEIFAPGATAARLQLTLPLVEGHQSSYYGASFASAPDGSLAVVYRTYTSHLVDDGYGGYEEWDREFLNVVSLADDGNSLSEKVELDSQEAYSGEWSNPLHFNDGSFATMFSDWETSANQIQRFGTDGSALGDPLILPGYNDGYTVQTLALSNGEMAVLSLTGSVTEGHVTLQILAADGTLIGTAQPLPEDVPSYVSQYGGNFRLLEMADGTVGVLSQLGEYAAAAGLVFIPTDSDGVLQSAVPLTALSDLLGIYVQISDASVFEDGTIGVVIQDESDSGQLIYQHLAADGTALADPVVLDEGLYYGSQKTSLLPDGGVALLNIDSSDGGYTLSAQFFDVDGTPMGPQTTLTSLTEDAYFYESEIFVQTDGSVTFSWNVEEYSPDTGWEIRAVHTTLAPLSFRGLTEGDDTEVLSAPEAVDGLGGDDMITGSDDIDRIQGGLGDDTLDGGAGDDFLFGGAGNNLLEGGTGDDAAYFAGDFADFSFAFNDDGGTVTVTGADSNDVVTGVERFDFLDQSLSPTELLIDGGFYDELLEGTEAGDALDGGLGDDTLRGNGGDDTLDGGVDRDRINGGAGDDMIQGGPDEDDGGDRIFGGLGDDIIDGGGGNDIIYGQEGNDLILGGFGADQLFGQTGDDVITGGAWSDLILGGDGADFVNGGWGHDRINGGAGADSFYHAGVRGHGTDWLQDYQAEEGDRLIFGNSEVSIDDFTVHFAHTDGSGDADVAEAFVVYSPTGVLAWALVDGAAQDHLWLKIPDQGTFDLLG